eukprot:s13413_g1.t1
MSSEDSPFVELTEVEKSALAEQVDLTDKAGWNYLKAIPCSRQKRKRMMTMPWVLHLYAGDGKGPDPVFKVMESSRVVVEIDIARSLACDMFKVIPSQKYHMKNHMVIPSQKYHMKNHMVIPNQKYHMKNHMVIQS